MAKAADNMKKPKRKKPEFYKGQVVAKCIRFSGDRKDTVLGYGGVVSYQPRSDDEDGYLLDMGIGWWYTNKTRVGDKMYLRPLTAKEIGPRRKRG